MKFLFFGEKNPLDSFTIEELRENEIRLDHRSEGLRKEMSAIEDQMSALFEKAREAKTKADEVSLARRIKTLEEELKMKSNAQAEIEKELRAVSNIRILKEHQREIEEAGVWGKLRKMDPERLAEAMRNMVLDGQDRDKLVTDVIGLTGEAMSAGAGYEEDLDDVLEKIRMVKKGEMEPEAAKKSLSREKDYA